ncbi:MAG: hypothetical protein ACLQU3_20875 [Limisphaerales bacterium]
MNTIDVSTERFASEPAPVPPFFLRALSRRACAAAWHDRTVRLLTLLLVLMHLATGCKLVELKMPGEPLPKEEFALRGQTREFANVLSTTVQHVADSIASQTNDPAIRTHCVQWKIGAVSAIRAATLRSSPKLALLDAWAFCRQMDEYLDQGAGAHLFGPFQTMAVTNSQALERRLTETARTLLSGSEYSKMDKFLAEYVARFPVQEISFDREPVVPHWEDFEEKPSRIPPAGTDAEALSDVADRLQMLGEQVPDEIRWRLTLEGDALETEWARTGVTLDRVDAALKQIAEAAASSPGVMTNAVLDLRTSFLPVLERFQGQWETTTRTLQTERQALTETLASERVAVLKDVAQQREAFMKETQEILRDLVDRSLTQARGVIRDVLFYVVLLAGIVLGLPFLFGFLLGRAWGRAAQAKRA